LTASVILYLLVGVLLVTLRPASRKCEKAQGFNALTGVWFVALGTLVMPILVIVCVIVIVVMSVGASQLTSGLILTVDAYFMAFLPSLLVSLTLLAFRVSVRRLSAFYGGMASAVIATIVLTGVFFDGMAIWRVNIFVPIVSALGAFGTFVLTSVLRDWLGVRTMFR
jgi:hypothetical protein